MEGALRWVCVFYSVRDYRIVTVEGAFREDIVQLRFRSINCSSTRPTLLIYTSRRNGDKWTRRWQANGWEIDPEVALSTLREWFSGVKTVGCLPFWRRKNNPR